MTLGRRGFSPPGNSSDWRIPPLMAALWALLFKAAAPGAVFANAHLLQMAMIGISVNLLKCFQACIQSMEN